MNYAYDPQVWTIETAYLFGDDFIVAPTMDPGATSVEVYFPPQSGDWIHLVRSTYVLIL
jgi:alpha-glucosidase (family GH31 glycosyl hydrolase)